MYFCFDSESCNLETKCLTYVNTKLSLAKHNGPTCNYETSIHGHCCKEGHRRLGPSPRPAILRRQDAVPPVPWNAQSPKLKVFLKAFFLKPDIFWFCNNFIDWINNNKHVFFSMQRSLEIRVPSDSLHCSTSSVDLRLSHYPLTLRYSPWLQVSIGTTSTFHVSEMDMGPVIPKPVPERLIEVRRYSVRECDAHKFKFKAELFPSHHLPSLPHNSAFDPHGPTRVQWSNRPPAYSA